MIHNTYTYEMFFQLVYVIDFYNLETYFQLNIPYILSYLVRVSYLNNTNINGVRFYWMYDKGYLTHTSSTF